MLGSILTQTFAGKQLFGVNMVTIATDDVITVYLVTMETGVSP